MGKAKNLLFTACLEHFGQIRPDSHIWLFSSTDNSHYNYNSRYLFGKLSKYPCKINTAAILSITCLRFARLTSAAINDF